MIDFREREQIAKDDRLREEKIEKEGDRRVHRRALCPGRKFFAGDSHIIRVCRVVCRAATGRGNAESEGGRRGRRCAFKEGERERKSKWEVVVVVSRRALGRATAVAAARRDQPRF